MAVLSEYLWLVVVGAFVAFGFGWGTGESHSAQDNVPAFLLAVAVL